MTEILEWGEKFGKDWWNDISHAELGELRNC
jgi:hypothetical protein